MPFMDHWQAAPSLADLDAPRVLRSPIDPITEPTGNPLLSSEIFSPIPSSFQYYPSTPNCQASLTSGIAGLQKIPDAKFSFQGLVPPPQTFPSPPPPLVTNTTTMGEPAPPANNFGLNADQFQTFCNLILQNQPQNNQASWKENTMIFFWPDMPPTYGSGKRIIINGKAYTRDSDTFCGEIISNGQRFGHAVVARNLPSKLVGCATTWFSDVLSPIEQQALLYEVEPLPMEGHFVLPCPRWRMALKAAFPPNHKSPLAALMANPFTIERLKAGESIHTWAMDQLARCRDAGILDDNARCTTVFACLDESLQDVLPDPDNKTVNQWIAAITTKADTYRARLTKEHSLVPGVTQVTTTTRSVPPVAGPQAAGPQGIFAQPPNSFQPPPTTASHLPQYPPAQAMYLPQQQTAPSYQQQQPGQVPLVQQQALDAQYRPEAQPPQQFFQHQAYLPQPPTGQQVQQYPQQTAAYLPNPYAYPPPQFTAQPEQQPPQAFGANRFGGNNGTYNQGYGQNNFGRAAFQTYGPNNPRPLPAGARPCRFCSGQHRDHDCPQRTNEISDCGICGGRHYTIVCIRAREAANANNGQGTGNYNNGQGSSNQGAFNMRLAPQSQPQRQLPASGTNLTPLHMGLGDQLPSATPTVVTVETSTPESDDEYKCCECATIFAAKNEMYRHAQYTGHQLGGISLLTTPAVPSPVNGFFVEACQVPFGSRNALFSHLRGSPSHVRLGDTVAIQALATAQ
ncbi:hypothetical protein BJ508DRAFT_331710, partial [Ascobolus immersus RN42]